MNDSTLPLRQPLRLLQRLQMRVGGREAVSHDVERVYTMVLKREPDGPGLEFYTDNIVTGRQTIVDVMEEMFKSEEYAVRNAVVVHHPVDAPEDAAVSESEPEPESEAQVEAAHAAAPEIAAEPELVSEPLQIPAPTPTPEEASEVRAQTVDRVWPDSAEFERFIRGLYRVLLQREADPGGLESYLRKIADGMKLDDMVDDFMASSEFTAAFSMNSNVARVLAETLLIELTSRDPGTAAVQNYANALAGGYPLREFVKELKRSPEFITGRSIAIEFGHLKVPAEVAVLAQELIAEKLTAEGGVIGLPPLVDVAAPAVDVGQMASLLRTLAMLNERRSAADVAPFASLSASAAATVP